MEKIKKEEKEECGGPLEGKKRLKPCKDTLRAQSVAERIYKIQVQHRSQV